MTQEAHAQLVVDVLVAVSDLPGTLFWKAASGVGVMPGRRVVRINVPGIPDIFGCYLGRAVGIECKTGTGVQRKSQLSFQRAFEKAGGLYILARCVNEAVSDLIQKHPYTI